MLNGSRTSLVVYGHKVVCHESMSGAERILKGTCCQRRPIVLNKVLINVSDKTLNRRSDRR